MGRIVVVGQSCRSCPSLFNVVAVSRPARCARQLRSCTRACGAGVGGGRIADSYARAQRRTLTSARASVHAPSGAEPSFISMAGGRAGQTAAQTPHPVQDA